jgi:hypothetical protein
METPQLSIRKKEFKEFKEFEEAKEAKFGSQTLGETRRA